jgi:alkylation response protein AidB-like acyl-CoA dehydrogenase
MDADPWPLPSHPLVEAARKVAEVLAPQAADVDRDGVPASSIDLLKSSGLLGVLGPIEYGGADAGIEVFWAVSELLAAADLSTWFVQAQHHSPLRTTLASDRHNAADRERLLRPLCDGSSMSGIVFSQLRSHPRILIEASPAAGGWTLTGVAPWYTGWGLSDVALFSGLTTDDQVVMGFGRPADQPGLHASAPLALAAMGGTATVRLRFDGLFIPDEDVVVVQPYAVWAETDARTVVNAQPAAFGVARAALASLRSSGEGDLATELGSELAGVRARALESFLGDDPAVVSRRLPLRVRAGQLVGDAVQAASILGGGRGMVLDQVPQRLVREAAFLQVQAQTPTVRNAQLGAIRARLAEPG